MPAKSGFASSRSRRKSSFYSQRLIVFSIYSKWNRAILPRGPTAQPAALETNDTALYAPVSKLRQLAPPSVETSELEVPTAIQILRSGRKATAERNPTGGALGVADQVLPP